MQFNYNINPIDVGNFFRGLESAQKREANQLAIDQQKATTQQQAQLQPLIQSYLGGDTSALNKIAAIDSGKASELQKLVAAQKPEKAPQLTDAELVNLGGAVKRVAMADPSAAPAVIQQIVQQYPQLAGFGNTLIAEFQRDPAAGMQMLDRALMPSETEKDDVVKTDILFNGTTVQGLRGGGIRVTTADGQRLTGDEARKAVTEARKVELDYNKQQKDLEVETARNKARAAKSVELESQDITAGLDAAQGLPTLKRAEKLLQIVETGKPEQAINYAQKSLGIQGADAAELENLLGKRILQQLKPIFGAQFTRAEGEWLREMESNFGTSRDANLRLIRQGQMLLDQRANMGYEAAINANDRRAARNILEWRDFSLDPQEDAQRKQQNQQPSITQPPTQQGGVVDFNNWRGGK